MQRKKIKKKRESRVEKPEEQSSFFISYRHGNTLLSTLREAYGPGFAKGRRSNMKLEELLKEEHCTSLSEYASRFLIY